VGSFYLATRKDRAAEADRLVQALNAQGWHRTYTWNSETVATPEEYARVAVAELDGVREADVLVVLLPGGYGTHVEIGAALALGKPVIIHAFDQKTLETPYPCVFHYHPGVTLLISKELDATAVSSCMGRCVSADSA